MKIFEISKFWLPPCPLPAPPSCPTFLPHLPAPFSQAIGQNSFLPQNPGRRYIWQKRPFLGSRSDPEAQKLLAWSQVDGQNLVSIKPWSQKSPFQWSGLNQTNNLCCICLNNRVRRLGFQHGATSGRSVFNVILHKLCVRNHFECLLKKLINSNKY